MAEPDRTTTPPLAPLLRDLARAAVIALFYFSSARLSLVFALSPEGLPPVWPPSGLLFAALLLSPWRSWPLTLLAVGIAITLASRAAGNGWLVGLAFGLANCAESLLAVLLVKRVLGKPISMARLREVVGLVALAALGSNALTALLGAAVAHWGFGTPFGEAWRVWWIGNGLGILVVGGAILSWADDYGAPRSISFTRLVEAASLCASFVLVAWWIFGSRPELNSIRLPYPIFPLLLWAALRFGPRGAATATLGLCAIAIAYTAQGSGPFAIAGQSGARHLREVQAFLFVASLLTLVAAAVVAERQRAQAALQGAYADLERLVTARTAALAAANLHEQAARARAEAAQQRLVLLAEASHAFAADSLDLDAALEAIARHTAEFVGDACAVRLISPDGVWLLPGVISCTEAETAAGIREMLARVPQRVGEGIAGRVAATGQPQFLPASSPEQLRAMVKPDYWPYVERLGILSGIVVPLRAQGRVLGVLTLLRTRNVLPYMLDDQLFAQDLADRAALAINNAQLFGERKRVEAELRRSAERLEALHAIDHAIMAAHSSQAIAHAVLERIRALIPCLRASVMVYDFEARMLGFLAVSPQDVTRLASGERLLLHPWDNADDLRRGELRMINDLQAAPPYALTAELLAEGVRAVLSAPMIAQGTLIGTLNLSADQPDAFTADHQQIVREVAAQLAVAIWQAQLYANEQQARATAETLRAANLALTGSLDLDAILETLLDYLAQLVPYDSANVMLCTSDTQLAVRSVRGYARWTDADQTRTIVFDAHDNTLINELLSSQQSVLIADTRADPRWQRPAGTEHVLSWLGIPLLAGGSVIGLYSVDKTEAGFFTPAHVRLAEALAAQAAVAIQNAHLFTEVRSGRERLQALSRRLVEVQEAERRHIARELHDEIGQALTGLNLILEMGTRLPPAAAAERLREAQTLVNELTARVRQLSLDLRPSILDDLGLLPTLLWYFKRYAAQTQVQVSFKHVGLERRFAPDVEIAAYRIVQEALTNVARYASVATVAVRVWAGNDLVGIQIEDRGSGFDLQAALLRHHSSGLAGMRERVLLLGGELTIDTTPGTGTSISAELPLGKMIERRRSER